MIEKDFKKYIRKYSVQDLITYCSEYSIKMYRQKQNYIFEDIPYKDKTNGRIGIIKNFSIIQPELIKICFYSLKYGNDYRNNKIDENVFYNLLNMLKLIENDNSTIDAKNKFDGLSFMQIIMNEQLDFQSMYLVNERFNRIIFILNDVNKKYSNHPEYINFDNEIKIMTGLDIESYSMLNLFLTLLIVGLNKSDITDIINNFKVNISGFNFDYNDIKKFITNNSNDYTFFHNDDLDWIFLKYNPIVKTQKNKFIITNIYSFILCYSDKIYWLIRNRYKSSSSQKFTNYFGYCFEKYLFELFLNYKIKSKKIPESNVKQPDWIIETQKYILIIEQKSGLFPLSCRNTGNPNKYDDIQKHINNNFVKAFKQLSSYKMESNKTIIRMCLLFDNIYIEENIQNIINDKIQISDKHLYWVVNIGDFEKLIYLLSKNEKEFNKVIENKIELEVQNYPDGRGLSVIMSKIENDYINNKINYYKKYSNEILKKLKEKQAQET